MVKQNNYLSELNKNLTLNKNNLPDEHSLGRLFLLTKEIGSWIIHKCIKTVLLDTNQLLCLIEPSLLDTDRLLCLIEPVLLDTDRLLCLIEPSLLDTNLLLCLIEPVLLDTDRLLCLIEPSLLDTDRLLCLIASYNYLILKYLLPVK